MSHFDLDVMIAAARRSVDADIDAEDGGATRMRIRETLAKHPRTRTKRLSIIAALIASIGGSTAFAYYATRPAEHAPANIAAPPAPEPVAAPIVTPMRIARHEPPVSEASPPSPPTPEPKPVTLERPKLTRVEPRGAAVEMPIVPPAPPAPDPELAAYRVAHEAHFRGGDLTAALAAWDAYLAQYPAGKLAVDARYSRALILVKLQRWADARAALRPLAEAPAGAYRQAEAAKLLAALP